MSSGAAQQPSGTGALDGIRVVDVTASLSGAYATRLLADLGASVFRVPNTRALSRRLQSREVADWIPGLHHVINARKELITFTVGTPDDAALRELVWSCDVVVEDVGLFDGSSSLLSWAEARERNPGIVAVTVTPFGSTGPYAERPSSDLTQWALSGLAWASPGVPDTAADLENEPPLAPTGVSVPSIVAGTVTAAAVLATLASKDQNARRVEVSELEALVALNYHPIAQFEYLGRMWPRGPNIIARQPNCYIPCGDGWLVLVAMSPRHWGALVEAMGSPDWAAGEAFVDAPTRAANWDALESLIIEWTTGRTGREITRDLQSRGLPVYWSATLAEAMNSHQVAARGFLRSVSSSDRNPAAYPGLPFITTQPEASRPRTALGQPGPRDPRLPLEGVRVLDFGQYIAVPFAAKWLAALGADVTQVESRQNPFDYRTTPPFADGIGGLNRAAGYNVLNAGKRSIALNLRTEEGRDIAARLAASSDVVMENFSTGAMGAWGLGYDALSASNPALVYVSVGAFGRTGPLKAYGGLHSIVNAFCGLADVTGYADGHPRILGSYFPDVVTGTYAVLATLAALHERERAGMGQYIDLAMTECLMTLLMEPILRLSRDGETPVRDGNHHPLHAPHNVYACEGVDQWIAVSVLTDDHWRGLCRALGCNEWAADARLASQSGRKAFERQLDEAIADWAAQRSKREAADLLLREGVPAAPVLDPSEIVADEHLRTARAFISEFEHPEVGPRAGAGIPWRIDGMETGRRLAAPLVGQYTSEILRERLDLSNDEISRLDAAGVFN